VKIVRSTGVTLGMAALGATALAGVLSAAPAGAYPPEQLARGERVWREVCAECHGPDSTFVDAPLLLRPGALKSYPNAAALFQYTRDSMPNDEPGILPEQDYWDVVAFLLQQQGVERDVELGPDTAADVPTGP
jgi:mono/diheme cytochrome c family protein